ncbi:MAG TPA: LysM peptidoglycan-binding domain-containing protein [Anaerolineae bacterium]
MSDDGVRVLVDGVTIIDNWTVHPETTDTVAIPISAGNHEITVEYFENTGLAMVQFDWERLADPEEEQVTISPTSGPVGTEIAVTASGFTPNTQVMVGIGRAQSEPTTSQPATTDATGALETQITVPANAEPGEPWVVLVNSPNTAESALSETFTVTGEPGTACGDTYTVRPGDWLSRIARQCATTVEAILAVNPGITNPDIIYSGQVLQMPGADTPAQVTITPDQGPVGTVIQVNAVGFDPNTQVTVGIGRANSEPTTSRTVMTGPPGAVETTIALPPDAGVGEPWVVLVSSTEESALSETFTVTGADVTATTRFNLNFRPLPTVNSQPMDVIPGGTTVPVVGRDENNSWLLVIYEGRRGWVAGWLTNIQGNLANVPVEQP